MCYFSSEGETVGPVLVPEDGPVTAVTARLSRLLGDRRPSLSPAFFEGDEQAVPVLVELLRDPDVKVRRLAPLGLEKVGPGARPAAPALREALRDEDPFVRAGVWAALLHIDRKAAAKTGVNPAELCAPSGVSRGLPVLLPAAEETDDGR